MPLTNIERHPRHFTPVKILTHCFYLKITAYLKEGRRYNASARQNVTVITESALVNTHHNLRYVVIYVNEYLKPRYFPGKKPAG
jgi:hypothetical protein